MLIDHLTEHFDKLSVVDIGAMIEDANPEDILFKLVMNPNVRTLSFEPQDAERQKLEKARPNCTVLPNVIADGQKRHFYEYGGRLISGLFEMDPFYASNFDYTPEALELIQKSEVQTTRLDDIPEARGADLLKVDVEGAECLVLENAKKVLESVLLVQIEMNFIPNQVGGNLYWEIGKLLHEQGFLLHRVIPMQILNFKPWLTPRGLSQQHVGEGIFIRDYRDTSNWSPDQLVKAAIILQDVYHGFDLASYLLRQADERLGTDLFQLHADQGWGG